jgi:hypothetical protein
MVAAEKASGGRSRPHYSIAPRLAWSSPAIRLWQLPCHLGRGNLPALAFFNPNRTGIQLLSGAALAPKFVGALLRCDTNFGFAHWEVKR